MCLRTSPWRRSWSPTARSGSPSGPTGTGRFDPRWLAQYGAVGTATPDDRTEAAKRLWTAGDISAGPAAGRWPRYLASRSHRRECLHALLSTGFVLLHDVPATGLVLTSPPAWASSARQITAACSTSASRPPRTTWRIPAAITPHTDNPYRDPVPTVQLLHCLVAAADGGGETRPAPTVSWRHAPCAPSSPAAFSLPGQHPRGSSPTRRDRRTPRHPPGHRPGPARPGPRDPVQPPLAPSRSGCPPREAGPFYAAYRAFAEHAQPPRS